MMSFSKKLLALVQKGSPWEFTDRWVQGSRFFAEMWSSADALAAVRKAWEGDMGSPVAGSQSG
jgi:hypothetical protein